MVWQTLIIPLSQVRWTDTRKDSQTRGISLKAMPMSLVLQNNNNKSFLLNIYDTPGHVNFSDEITAALRICDGVVVVVDAIEGVCTCLHAPELTNI